MTFFRDILNYRSSRSIQASAALLVLCAAAGYGILSDSDVAAFLGQLADRLQDVVFEDQTTFTSLGAFGVLGIGLIYGLKHATEVDHIVAVSAIVSEHRKLSRAALVGGLWGAGHTVSLLLVGLLVLGMRSAIPERVAGLLELCVALMIIGLGLSATAKAFSRRGDFHLHRHTHGSLTHVHLHFHEPGTEHVEPVASHSHAIARIGLKPVLVGAMHGLAGSAALTLLVLTQIHSLLLGLLYLAVFGLGSIAGMLLMSGLVGLPFVWSARRLTSIHCGLQMTAGTFSVCFGLWYAYAICVANGLVITFHPI